MRRDCLSQDSSSLEARYLQKNKPLSPYMGQKLSYFCDTTQIDIPAEYPLATRTIIRAPMGNGWGPVSSYLRSLVQSRPPKSIHRLFHAPITPPGTLWRFTIDGYYSSSKVCRILLYMYYMRGEEECQMFFWKKMHCIVLIMSLGWCDMYFEPSL